MESGRLHSHVLFIEAGTLQKRDDRFRAVAQLPVDRFQIVSGCNITDSPNRHAGRHFSFGKTFDRDDSATAVPIRDALPDKKTARVNSKRKEKRANDNGRADVLQKMMFVQP